MFFQMYFSCISLLSFFEIPNTSKRNFYEHIVYRVQGPDVQNILSLRRSFVADSLSLLVHTKSVVGIFFAEKLY